MGSYKGRWPLGRGFERFYGFLGGERNSWYPDLVHDNHQVDPPATPEEGYHLSKDLSDKAIEFIRDAKVVDPDKPFFMYLVPAGRPRAAPRLRRSGRTSTRARFDQGYEAIRAGDPGAPEGARPAPRGHRAVADQPARRAGDDRPRRAALAAAGHRPSVGLAERRRAAAVRADGRGVRRDTSPTPTTSSAGSSTTWKSPGSSTTRSSSWSPTTAPAARVARTARSTSGGSSTASPTRPISHSSTSTSSAARSPTTTTTPAGPGRSTRRSPTGSAGPDTKAASPTCAWSPGRRSIQAQSEPRQQYIHAVDVVPTIYELLGIEPPDGDQGLRAEPDRGRELRRQPDRRERPGKETQFYAMLGQRSIYHEGWLACTVHPPISGWGKFDAGRLGALQPRGGPRTVQEPRRAGARAARAAEEPVVLLRRASTTGCRSTTAPRSNRFLPSAPTAAEPRERYDYYPDCADVPEEGGVRINGRSYTIAAGVTVDSAEAEGVLYAHGGVAGGHSLYIKDQRLRYTFNWVGTHLQEIVADREITPGHARLHRRVHGQAARTRTRPCPGSPERSPSTWTTKRSAAVRSSPSPASSAWSATASASAATAPRRSRPDYTAPVPLHRRNDRQGGRRRLWRALRRPRSRGARLVH